VGEEDEKEKRGGGKDPSKMIGLVGHYVARIGGQKEEAS
jgi:hypothetical protein